MKVNRELDTGYLFQVKGFNIRTRNLAKSYLGGLMTDIIG